MMERVLGVFIGEGTSDEPLSRLVTAAFERRGVDADIRSLNADRLGANGCTVSAKIEAAKKLFTDFQFVIIHRDCDNQEPAVRLEEIRSAVNACLGMEFPSVALVPRTMSEAWLLLDEEAIRKTAGKPNSRVALNLPKPKSVESVRDPKEMLHNVLLVASEETGRRREKRAKKFGAHRAHLMNQLEPEHLANVPSWQYTIDDIDAYIDRFVNV